MTLPAVGDEILGKYRIIRKLGEGGMGVVYAATHIELQETVAIKMLTPELALREEIVGRFTREARAAAKIKSDHAVRVLDVGKLENGVPYMVMEFLEGQDLAHVLRANEKLSLRDAIKYVAECAEALGEAHRLGIVHRDIKPANLFLSTRSNGTQLVKVLDFGISKVSNDGLMGGSGATRTEAVMGTPMYMSPEQLRSSRDVDARADVWSLGVVFYELLTGAFPFEGESIPVLFASILGLPYKPIRQQRPDLPKAIEEIMLKVLEKDRDKRFASVEEFVQALAPYTQAEGAAVVGGGSTRLGSGKWMQDATDATLYADASRSASGRTGRTLALVAVALLALAGGGVVVWSLTGNGPETNPDLAAGKPSAASTPAVTPAGQVVATTEPRQAEAPAASSSTTAPASPDTSAGIKTAVTTPLGTATVKTGVPVVKPPGTNKVFEVGGRK